MRLEKLTFEQNVLCFHQKTVVTEINDETELDKFSFLIFLKKDSDNLNEKMKFLVGGVDFLYYFGCFDYLSIKSDCFVGLCGRI